MSLSIHSDDHFMKEALKQAEYAFEEGEVPVGAVVVCQHTIISRAYNQVEKLQDVTAHAEMLAITAAQDYLGAKYLRNCTLYVTLEPCTMCAGAIYWSQLDKVVFGAADAQKGFLRLKPNVLLARTKVVPGLEAETCGSLMNRFFNKVRRNN
ncbi:MAG: nucleoside deaminase [Cyclobacteriaceae bacterium]